MQIDWMVPIGKFEKEPSAGGEKAEVLLEVRERGRRVLDDVAGHNGSETAVVVRDAPAVVLDHLEAGRAVEPLPGDVDQLGIDFRPADLPETVQASDEHFGTDRASGDKKSPARARRHPCREVVEPIADAALQGKELLGILFHAVLSSSHEQLDEPVPASSLPDRIGLERVVRLAIGHRQRTDASVTARDGVPVSCPDVTLETGS